MTPDAPEDDRTQWQPREGGSVPRTDIDLGGDAGFEKTQWAPGNPPGWQPTPRTIPRGPAPDRTEIVAPPAVDASGNLPIGTRLGEFEITGLVGEGGFGIVYLAQDHSLQRRVALKEYMPSSLAARSGGSLVQVKSERHRETFEAGLKSFINEARLLASFDHPALVRVYRFWEANGTAYMVMPFLEGVTLKDVLKSLPARPDETWLKSVLGPLTEALEVIHAEQCYHRDIAPDNVMLLKGSNRWLLLDFGAARRVIGDMTQALTVILKPGYAPVEQYAEIPGMKQGAWTDVYALAAVVYFCIMGRTPPPSVGRLLNDTYQPLAIAAAGRYGHAFLAAVDKALAVRPEARTQTIAEFRHDLGLGAAPPDAYTSRPLPPDATIAVIRDRDRDRDSATAPTQFAPRTAAAPTAQATQFPATQLVAAPAPDTAPMPLAAAAMPAASAPAPKKGNGALIGGGVAVLAALGIGGFLLSRPASSPAPAPQVAAGTTAAPSTASPAIVPPPPAPAPPPLPTRFDPSEEFQRVVAAQSPDYRLQLQTNKVSYRIGRDNLNFTLRSERDGFVHLFIYGADRQLLQPYPNTRGRPLEIKAGQPLTLPRPPDVFTATAPAGRTELLVLVSASPRDHELLKPKNDQGWRFYPAPEQALARLQEAGTTAIGSGPILAGKAVCAPNVSPCDESFGAALVAVEIVP